MREYGKFDQQLVVGLDAVRVRVNTINRTDGDAGRLIVVAYAFGAAVWVDFIDFFPHGDGLIWAFRFTHVAIDAAVVDQ
ncbi:hypothetical protein AYI95_19640 [Shewanella xiamenensis]|nr:hypothetical protein AYI95_19640 [Shewanella xiamenensis]